MRRWLARLSYSFMIFAFLLAWIAWGSMRGYRDSMPIWKVWLCYAGAVGCFVLAAIGARERHRPGR